MRCRTGVGLCLATAALVVSGCASSESSASLPEGPDRRVPVHVDLGSAREAVNVVSEDEVTRTWIETPADAAWQQLIGLFAELGFGAETIQGMDPATRTLVAMRSRVRRIADRRPSVFLNCGRTVTDVRADNGQVEVALTTRLVPENGGTTVLMRLEAVSTDFDSGARVGCSSTGRLEELIANRLEKGGLRR